MNPKSVYFAHGQESGPWGTKIQCLAKIAKERGFFVESPDYSHTKDPEERVRYLLEIHPPANQQLILVGSSMGAYVSAVASSRLNPQGLFLLAPAFYIKEYQQQNPKPCCADTVIIHAWEDEVVPVGNSIRYAQEYQTELHILHSNHRLTSALPVIAIIFEQFLDRFMQN